MEAFFAYFPQIDTNHLFLFFLAYSFIGWCCEEIWCWVLVSHFKYFEKRGMLFGPICPIYGFGAVGILYLVNPWRDTYIPLFLVSVLVTSILEYFTSWLLETLFHTKWWDYSDQFLNINGRVCLVNAIAFGIGGLALEHVLHPLMERIIYWPPVQPWLRLIGAVLATVLAADIVATVRKLIDFSATMEKFKVYGEQLRERYEGEDWFRTQSLRSMLESVRARAKLEPGKFSRSFLENAEKYSERQQSVEYWLKRFPSMSSKHYEKQLEHLKTVMAERRAQRAEKKAKK